MTYAERLNRLTIEKIVEKLEAMLAEGRKPGGATVPRPEGPPARNRKAPSRRQEG